MHKPEYLMSTDGLMSPRDVVRLIHPEDLENTITLPDAILEELYAKTINLGPAYHEIVRALQDFHEMQEDYKNRKTMDEARLITGARTAEQEENAIAPLRVFAEHFFGENSERFNDLFHPVTHR